MVNLADLPNASALSGTETLPMQQGSGAVKVTANQLLSRAAGQVIPLEIGGQRIVTVTSNGLGVGIPGPERGLHVGGATESACTIRVAGNGPATYGSVEFQSGGNVFRLRNPVGGLTFTQVGVSERGRITGAGDLVWGPNGDTMLVSASANTQSGVGLTAETAHVARYSSGPKVFIQTLGQTTSSHLLQFWYGATSTGSITHTSSSTAYNTTSDYRLPWKAGHVPLTGSGEFIDALNPRFFPEVGHAGFIAHHVAEVSPSSVTGEKDAVDEKGNPKYQQMDASSPDIMANIIAELQSLRRRVAALEAAT